MKKELDDLVSGKRGRVGNGSTEAIDAARGWARNLMEIVEREENRGRVEDFVEFYVLYRRVYKFCVSRDKPASLAFVVQWFL